MTELDKALSLLLSKLERWMEHLILMLPNLFIALVILVITIFIARLFHKGTDKVLTRFSHSVALNNLISNLVYVTTLLIGIFFVLSVLNLDKTVTTMLGAVGIIGLALGFAFQDIAANFMSGVIIAVRKPFVVGDVVETNTYFGTIERINMRTTDIRKVTGELVKMPNRKIFENPLVNLTHYGIRRIDLDVRVSFAENLENVKEVVIGAVKDVKGQIETKEVEVMYKEFAEDSIKFEVRFWIQYHRQFDFNEARSQAIMKIKMAFDQNGITIPFPIRTLDFGIKGGEKMSDQLASLTKNQNPEGEKADKIKNEN